ncbi:MAG: hypothetical protein ACI38U_03260 [Corynebacterium sp.]|uniref:hypothetical protein n=1 Tax=Corynebacterium sp. TaxID=1720 RepID=UPI003F112401
MNTKKKEFDKNSAMSWLKVWLSVVVGTFLGSSIVPALLEKVRTNGTWGEAIDHGGEFLFTQWFPTFLVFSAIAWGIALVAWRKGNLH